VSQRVTAKLEISETGSVVPIVSPSQQDRAPRMVDDQEQTMAPRRGLPGPQIVAAAWGEGRPQGSQDGGSRPPRREFQERPVVERTPTAAEQDSQWRTKMRPDAPASSLLYHLVMAARLLLPCHWICCTRHSTKAESCERELSLRHLISHPNRVCVR